MRKFGVPLTAFVITLFFTVASYAASGILEVHSDPAGAKVYINNIPVGKTPYQNVEIPTGRQEIKIVLSDEFAPIMKTIVIDEVKPQVIKVKFEKTAPPEPAKVEDAPVVKKDGGNVQLASIPTGAEVYINGEKRMHAPIAYRNMDPGKYDVEFHFHEKVLRGNFTIIKGETVKLVADFNANKVVNKWEEALKRKEEEAQRAKAKKYRDELVELIDDFKSEMQCGKDGEYYCCYSSFKTETILSALKKNGKFDAACADTIRWSDRAWDKKPVSLHFRIVIEYIKDENRIECLKQRTSVSPTKGKDLSVEKCFDYSLTPEVMQAL